MVWRMAPRQDPGASLRCQYMGRRLGTHVLLALGVFSIAVPLASAAPPRTVRIVSAGSSSVHDAVPEGIAADGSRTLFSTSEALLSADTNGVSDVYARERDGSLHLISSGKGAAPSLFAAVSADGGRVIYTTTNRDLLSDTDSSSDLYERRRDGSLRQVSGGNGAFSAFFVAVSASGGDVIFASSEKLAGDTDAQQDLFDRRADGTLRLVTPRTAAAVPIPSGPVALTDDGSTVFIRTAEALVAADRDAQPDVYGIPTAGGAYTLWTPGTADAVTGFPDHAGRRVWFTTRSRLAKADTDAALDVYARTATGAIQLASGGAAGIDASLETALADGTVLFTTSEKLLAADHDTTGVDLYERTGDGTLRLVSGGSEDGTDTGLLGVNADGAVAFHTDASLVPADGDGLDDIYVRRRDGGLLYLSPSTPAFTITFPTPVIPSRDARTVINAPDLPGTGDANGQDDAYEVTSTGLRLLAATPAGTGTGGIESADGSRILLTTAAALTGADHDSAVDVYEADFALPVVTGVPTFAGDVHAGSVQTCLPPGAVGEGITFLTSWFRGATAIPGATQQTYRPVVADAGLQLHCRSTARNGIGAAGADSAARTIAPAATTAALGGFPVLGTKLTCTAFAGAAQVTYRWSRGTTRVVHRNAQTYRVGRGDLGWRLTCTAVARSGALSTTAVQRVRVPRFCTVPTVRGLLLAAARVRLGAAGCATSPKRMIGRGVGRGRVLGTSPRKGTRRPNGAVVTVNVRK